MAAKSMYGSFVGKKVRIRTRVGPVDGYLRSVSDFELALESGAGMPILLPKRAVLQVEVISDDCRPGKLVTSPRDLLSRMVGEVGTFHVGGSALSAAIDTVGTFEVLVRTGQRTLLIPKHAIERVTFKPSELMWR